MYGLYCIFALFSIDDFLINHTTNLYNYKSYVYINTNITIVSYLFVYMFTENVI